MAAVSVMQFWLILTFVICLFKRVEASSARNDVDTCPETKDLWERQAAIHSASCGGVSEYHCLRDKDGKKRELCLEKTRILQGHCPIVTGKGFLDWEPCNESLPGCPDNHYLSNEVYQFPFCFGNNTPSPMKKGNKDTEEDSDVEIIVPVVILILVAVGVVIALIYYLNKRRNRGPNYESKDEEVCLMEQDKKYSREEVVKKYHVQQGLASLQKHDALLITGMLGTAVTSTAESIMKEFSNSASHSGWSFKSCKCQELPVKFDPKTIYFVYGWFGLYNDNPCSMLDVKINLNSIDSTLRKKTENKFIIGLRSDFYRRYGSDLEAYEELFHKSMSLDSVDKMRDQGYEDHFKSKIKNACSNSECPCRRLTFDMIMDKKESKIGIPLRLAILTNDHDLIATFLEYKSFKKTLMENFKSLKTTDLELYQCIMYVCFKGDLKRSENLDKGLVNSLHFNVSKESVEQKMSDMEKYIRMRKSDQRQNVEASKATYVFWHPFIYICAFHALFESNPEEVVKYCNVEAILQLVRPPSRSDRKTNYFTVTATEEQVKIFQGRIKSEGHDEMYAAHPLLEFK